MVLTSAWWQFLENVEEKRKDYAEMFTHHIFTTTLLFLSYGYYHMRVGIVILCIMDFVDIILPVSVGLEQVATRGRILARAIYHNSYGLIKDGVTKAH